MENNYVNRSPVTRANPWVKALALLLAVACGVGAIFAWGYTLLHWNDLFREGDCTTSPAWYQARSNSFAALRRLLNFEWESAYTDGGLTYLNQRDYDALKQQLAPENTNFRYTVRDDATGRLLFSSRGEDSLAGVDEVTAALLAYPERPNVWYSNVDGEVIFIDGAVGEGTAVEGAADLAVEFGVLSELTVHDAFWETQVSYRRADPVWFYAAMALSAAFLALTIFLLCCAGRRQGVDGFALNWSDRVPYDLYLPAVVCGVVGAWGAAFVLFHDVVLAENGDRLPALWGVGALLALGLALTLAALMSTAARCKTHTLLRGTLTWRLGSWCLRGLKGLWAALREGVSRLVSHLPLAAEVALGAAGYFIVKGFLTAAMFHSHSGGAAFLLLLLNGALLALVLRWSMAWADLRRATQAIVSGHPDTAVDTSRMKYLPALRQHARQLGDLGGAIDSAVKEQLKSERMKAELITNVSHDLKTPLTSIINYVDLLKKEDIPGEKAREYLEVLDRKSQILKKLTADLVEASKASTGALPVNTERIGVNQLVNQALGEYQGKLTEAGLTPVVTLPPEEVYVTADGRHLWRILDNLMGNCVKYALPGTRVYLDAAVWDGGVVLSVKNVSARQLNLSADALVERFVRGDESRTTEGSGLGLSIAKSLTELNGGAFTLSVDGDLFKATLRFPRVD